MIVDFRLRPPYGSFVRLDVPYGRSGQWLTNRIGVPFPESASQQSMEMTLREMDEVGITTGVVTGRAWSPGVSNDELAELCRAYPGRFVGIASVDLTRRGEMVKEFRRAIEELGLRGLILEPGIGTQPHVDVDHGTLYALYEEAQRLAVPVLFTLSVFVGTDIGYCQRNMIALDRVAGDFRRVNFVVAHAGWPYVQEAVGLGLRRPNVYLSPDLYNFDFPLGQAFFDAANSYLQDQYLYASAYPLYPLKSAVEKTVAGLRSDAVREKALYANAARLLRLG